MPIPCAPRAIAQVGSQPRQAGLDIDACERGNACLNPRIEVSVRSRPERSQKSVDTVLWNRYRTNPHTRFWTESRRERGDRRELESIDRQEFRQVILRQPETIARWIEREHYDSLAGDSDALPQASQLVSPVMHGQHAHYRVERRVGKRQLFCPCLDGRRRAARSLGEHH